VGILALAPKYLNERTVIRV